MPGLRAGGGRTYKRGGAVHSDAKQDKALIVRGTSDYIYVNGNGLQYYFKDETYNTLGVTGNGLDSDYGNTYATINQSYSGTDSVTYAFEVSLFSSPTKLTQLTSGPSATIVVSGNYTGTLTGTVVISSQGTGSSATIVQPTAVVMKLIKY
jgi:hypothetical protein